MIVSMNASKTASNAVMPQLEKSVVIGMMTIVWNGVTRSFVHRIQNAELTNVSPWHRTMHVTRRYSLKSGVRSDSQRGQALSMGSAVASVQKSHLNSRPQPMAHTDLRPLTQRSTQ